MSAPTVASYHTTEIDQTKCMGRKAKKIDNDRRWQARNGSIRHVLHAYQCENQPTAGSDICEECRILEAYGYAHGPTKKKGWHGRINDTDLNSLTADSKIAGSKWFYDELMSGGIKYVGPSVTPTMPELITEVRLLRARIWMV